VPAQYAPERRDESNGHSHDHDHDNEHDHGHDHENGHGHGHENGHALENGVHESDHQPEAVEAEPDAAEAISEGAAQDAPSEDDEEKPAGVGATTETA
jgi:hypothetical protein